MFWGLLKDKLQASNSKGWLAINVGGDSTKSMYWFD
jgi:hypothetical protein